MATTTNVAAAKRTIERQLARGPGSAAKIAAQATAALSGMRNVDQALRVVVCRHATAGPTASLRPLSASEMSGKNVPQKMAKHSPTRTRLLSKKTVSRESRE